MARGPIPDKPSIFARIWAWILRRNKPPSINLSFLTTRATAEEVGRAWLREREARGGLESAIVVNYEDVAGRPQRVKTRPQ